MRYTKTIMLAMGVMLSGQAFSADLSQEEIGKLGNSLTPFGAIKAGNEAGTIPAWTGGLCNPPENYAPIEGERGGSPYANPFPDEEPRLVITAANLAEYADKIDAGTKALMKRYPETFRMDVYPTHRTACFPDWAYENTIENVDKPRLVGDAPGLENAHAQVPFPIPKNGYQAMWNSNVKFDQPRSGGTQAAYLVDASGNSTLLSIQNIPNRNYYWDNELDKVPNNQPYWMLLAETIDPSSVAGTKQMRHSFLNAHERETMAWSYVPGQRRVRLAPEFKYDTVSTQSGGILLYDEINGFSGDMDKYNFKLVGRKEMFVPYNAYEAWGTAPEVTNTPNHANPDVIRWELHRVWEVEATLKEGERHVQQTKRFLLDEDSWSILVYHALDHGGNIHHVMYQLSIQRYDVPMYSNGQYLLYDLSKGVYSHGSLMGAPGMTGFPTIESFPPNFFTPGSMAGSGLR